MERARQGKEELNILARRTDWLAQKDNTVEPQRGISTAKHLKVTTTLEEPRS
jgi:hypothetical protein